MTRRKVKNQYLVILNKDKPVEEISRATGISLKMVYYYLKQLGIVPINHKKIALPSADELRAEGLKQRELAIKYNVSVGTIKRRLHGNNDTVGVRGAIEAEKETK